MAEYWGLRDIAKRMGVTTRTIHRWHRGRGFLMYRRSGRRRHGLWFTNDGLIQAWELTLCRLDRHPTKSE